MPEQVCQLRPQLRSGVGDAVHWFLDDMLQHGKVASPRSVIRSSAMLEMLRHISRVPVIYLFLPSAQ